MVKIDSKFAFISVHFNDIILCYRDVSTFKVSKGKVLSKVVALKYTYKTLFFVVLRRDKTHPI